MARRAITASPFSRACRSTASTSRTSAARPTAATSRSCSARRPDLKTRSGDQSEIRAQALVPRRDARSSRPAPGSEAARDPRRRPQCRAARARRLEPQADAQGDLAHAGRVREDERGARGRYLGLYFARADAGAGEALLVVELSRYG